MKTIKKLLNYKGSMQEFEISYDIKKGDTVYNITYGGRENPERFNICEPATMLDLNHSAEKSHQCRTDLGYGPRETYFKLITLPEGKVIRKGDMVRCKGEGYPHWKDEEFECTQVFANNTIGIRKCIRVSAEDFDVIVDG